MSIPTIECLGAELTMRIVGAIPDPAEVDDYGERSVRYYGFRGDFAVPGPERSWRRVRPTASAFRRLSSPRSKAGSRLLGSVAFPLAARGLGRALRRQFDTDISPQNISRAGLAAIREAVRRLGIDAEHVIYGHTHRPGPLERDDSSAWQLGNGTKLHATGCWNWSPGLCGPTAEQSLYWPGTVTWVEESGPPTRTELLATARAARFTRSRRELPRPISRPGLAQPAASRRSGHRLLARVLLKEMRCVLDQGRLRCPIASPKRSPTLGGMIGSESAQRRDRPLVGAHRLEHPLSRLAAGRIGRRREHERKRARSAFEAWSGNGAS